MSEAETLWAQLSAMNPGKSILLKADLQQIFKKINPVDRATLMTDLVFLGLGDIKPIDASPDPAFEFVPLSDISKETLDNALAEPLQFKNAPNITVVKNKMRLPADAEPVFAMVTNDQGIAMRMIVVDTAGLDADNNRTTTHAEALKTIRETQASAQESEVMALHGMKKPASSAQQK